MSTAVAAIQTQLPLIPGFPAWCKRTEVGLKIESKKPVTLKQWMAAFTILDKTKRGHQWQIGDMLNEGETLFGDECYQVIDPDEESKLEQSTGETYRQYQQVAERIKVGRRRPKLFFGHHHAVAYLPPDEQDYWLARAEDEGLSVQKLRKAIKGEADKASHEDDLKVLQDAEVRAWLETDIKRNREEEPNIPLQASFLRNMMHSRIGQSQWQLDRTIETDCNIVREAVKELLGSADEVFMWLQSRNYFMSPLDVDARLTLLVDQKRIKSQEEEGRKEGQKGGMKTVYLPLRNSLDVDEDFEKDAI